MGDNPRIGDNRETLEAGGVGHVDPGGEEGKAKIEADEDIVLETARATTRHTLGDRTVLITSGATTEAVDPLGWSRLEPVQYRSGRLCGPPKRRRPVSVQIAFTQVDRPIDESPM
jgi:hypothetical protein